MIVVTLSGTSYRAVFRLARDEARLIQSENLAVDSEAPLSNEEFEAAAWETANTKAKQLGWFDKGKAVEYLFAANLQQADLAARKQGWRSRGKAQWAKPDGTKVRFLELVEHLVIVETGQVVHVVGELPAEAKRLRRIRYNAL
jgi:hypothetical protein